MLLEYTPYEAVSVPNSFSGIVFNSNGLEPEPEPEPEPGSGPGLESSRIVTCSSPIKLK